MTFKTWINDLRNVQSVINNISNTRVIIDGATGLLNTNSLKEMSSAVSGLSKEQALLVLSTKNLNAAQQEQVLLAAGIISSENNITASAISQALAKTQLSATEKEALLTKLGLIDATTGEAIANATCTKEELLKVLATKGIIGADADAIISSIGLTSANSAQAISFDLLTASIWANIKALGKWLITNPVGWVILGGTAIFGLVKAYDALTDSVEEVQERTDKLLDSYNSAISEANSNAKTIESLADRYGELSKGVNNLGENVSLTSDEYSEYKGIVDQIAEMFPTLITGYTNEGTAILSLKGNVEKLRDAYKEAQTEAYNLLIVSGEDSDGNDIISNYKNQVNGNESWLSKQSSYIDGEGGARDAIDIITKLTGALTPDEFRDTYNELYEQYKNIWNSDKIQEALKSSGFEELSHAPKWGELTSDDLAKVKSTAQATIQTYKAEIDSRLKNVDTLANAYLMTNEDYSKLDEQSQTAASLIVNSITEDIANGFKTKVDVGAYVANIISKIKDNPDLNKSLVDLFREDFSSMSVDEAKNKLDGYINTIAKILNEDPVELKVRLGFDDYDDVEPLKTKVQGFLKDEFDDKVGELSLEDLDVASKLEIPEGTLLTWDELKQKIEEAKNAIPEEAPILFSDLFNNDSIDKTKQKLLDLATSGELSAETITSTEDYKALLDELGISADEFVNKISEFNIQYNEDNYNSLIDLLSRVRKGEILSADEATTLIATYDSLAGELVKTGNGYSFNESAIISLTNKYAETSNLAISNEVKKTNAAIEGVKERINAYGIEMEALKTIQKIYEDTGSKIEVMNWLKDNGYSMFMASNYLDIANEYSELEKKSESLKGKMLEQIETTTSAAKSTETALDRITKKYKELTDVIGSNVNLIKSQISLLETRGSTVGRAYYDELISQSTEKINVLTEQYNELRKQFLQTDKGTEEWLELNAAILETQNAIIEAKTDIEGFQNSIDKLHWDELDKITDAIGNISDEAKSVVDLLNTDDVLDDNGNFTKDAITALAMYGEQLESAQYLISKYSKEIEYLNGEYIKGTITVEEYNEKMNDLNDKQWESVDAYNAAKKAIIELRKKGIDEEIDALEELYDARKKAWEQEKDQHDWEKTVSENETNINKLKAQIAELQNDNSLAGIKKRKELEDELKDLESDWEDTLYDHVYDERQDQLDKELDDKKKALEKTLDDEEKLVADSIDLVNKNSTTILDNLNRLSREYGIQMSNSLTEPFTHGENALSHYSTMFSEANSAFTDQLNYTAMGIYQLQLDADNAAVSVVNMFNSANGTLLEQLSLVRQSLQEITDKANEAANAVRNAGVATPTNTTTTASNSTSSTNRSLGDMAHDTSGTTLPNAGTWKNVQNDIEKTKKDLEAIEKQKKVGLVKNTPNKFTTISRGYASGTQSATKGLHPIYEDGVEIIEKDGCLIYPIGAFDGGEKVFNNEQTQRLWELSQNPDVMEKFRQELLNIRPCIDFKFGNTAPVTKTNQNVNVQQHFDALVKVEGDMTPSVYDQLVNDKRIDKLLEGKTFTYFANAYNTRGYKL